jgi:hypothetical protein
VSFKISATLYVDDNLVDVFGVLLEVTLQEYQAVVLDRPVELAAIPNVV